MRPEQKIILSCRQTGERAERLLDWIDQSRLMLKAQARSLRTEVQAISSALLAVVEAVEKPPAAGLLGAWGTDRSSIVGAMMTRAAADAPVDMSRVVLDRDRIQAAIPSDAGGGAAAIFRLVSAARVESPFRFPVRVSLLSQLDLVKIIAGAYLVHVPPRRQRRILPDAIAHRLSTKTDDVGQQAFSGMSRRDIDGLRDTLHTAAPASPGLRELDAAGYWATIGGLIPHLPDQVRRQVLALLWAEDPALTALFNRLSDAIELLGFSGEAFTGIEALLSRDPETGQMVRHPTSVAAASTLLGSETRTDQTVRISSRNGRATDVERSTLAALADEIWLPVAPETLSLLETADLLVLPAPAPVMLWPPPHGRDVPLDARAVGAHLSASEAEEVFAARKASYLAERTVQLHGLTSLTVAVNRQLSPEACTIDAETSILVSTWVERTQGATAQQRELRRTGLSILVAPGDTPRGRRPQGGRPTDQTTPSIDADIVSEVLAGNVEWVSDWTPHRPFRNVFTWNPPASSQLETPVHRFETHPPTDLRAVETMGEAAEILALGRAQSADHARSPTAAESGSTADIALLLQWITQATTTTLHHQQLSAQLTELRRALSARFLRLHISNDPLSVVEWRRQIANVTRNRLDHALQKGGFARLLGAMTFTERDALAVIARIKIEDPRATATRIPDLRSIEPQRIVEVGLETWIEAMRQVAREPSLMRAVHIPGALVAHMVDELVLGALRIGLQERLTEAVRHIQRNAARALDCETGVAALLERGVNTYLETLDRHGGTDDRPSSHDQRFGMSALGSRPQAAAHTVAVAWPDDFASLVEANILGAGLLGGAGHLNRQLGEILAAMSHQSFEAAT